MRGPVRVLLAAALLLSLALGGSSTAAADDPVGAPLPSDAPRVATELDSLRSRLFDNRQTANAVQARLTEAAIALDATEQQLAAVSGQVDRVREQLREKAAVAYVRHQESGLDEFSVGNRLDYASGAKYLKVAAALDGDTLADLLRAQEQLSGARRERAAVRDDLASRADRLDQERDDLEGRIRTATADLAKWGAVTVMGDTQLTGPQLAAWYRSTGAQPVLAAGTTIDDVARMYVEEGQAEQVRGDLAFAQAIIETGGFRVAAGNNYSGIGVCDSCTGGNSFATPRDGIRAQIQLLRNYADPTSRAANLRYPPAPGLYGHDADKAARLYDTFFLKGKAPLWNQMGGGNWATDPTYAPKVIGTYVQMIVFANANPS